MAPEKSEIVRVSSIHNVGDAKKVFPKDWFILGKWVNFQSLMEEGFIVQCLFDCFGWTPLLEKFNSWHYVLYALFWRAARQDEVSIRGADNGREVIISLKIVVAVIGCPKEDLVFNKD